MASIEKRGKGSFRLVVELGYGPDGKRIKRTKTIQVKNKSEAKEELAKFQTEVLSGAYFTPEKMTFKEFAENEWLKKYAEKELSASSVKHYVYQLHSHVLPVFGHMRLEDIKTMHIVNFMNQLDTLDARKDGKQIKLSGSTKGFIFRVLKSILKRAVEWRVVSRDPMNGVKRPTVEKQSMKYYDETEANSVIHALYQEPTLWRLYFLGLMFGGFRRGEFLALEWTDVDFEDSTISITKSLSLTTNGEPLIKKPKTKSSERVVDMPLWYMKELRDFYTEWEDERDQSGDQWQGGDNQFIFHSGLGKPFHFHTPTVMWRDIIKKHGIKKIRLHDLRHTAATLLIEAGMEEGMNADVTLKALQQRLGHSTMHMTADIYTHVTKKVSKKMASQLEKFDPRKNGPQSVPKS